MSRNRAGSAGLLSKQWRSSMMQMNDTITWPEPPEDPQKRRRSHSKPSKTVNRPHTTPQAESISVKTFTAFIDKQAGEFSASHVDFMQRFGAGTQLNSTHADFATADSTTGAEILESIMRRNSEATKRKPPRPSEGCVGSIREPTLQSPHIKRRPSADSSSSQSTTDSESLLANRLSTVKFSSTDSSSSESTSSESTSRESSRPPSRGGNSCGSLDVPDNLPEAEGLDTERGFEWELNQFKEGNVPFSAIAAHFDRNDPDMRRSVVEAVGMATPHATLQSTQALTERLSDSNPFVRRASVNSLCAVIAKAQHSEAVELAQRILMRADSYVKYDTIEGLTKFAMKGSRRAIKVMDLYRSEDEDPSIRCKADRSLLTVGKAGWKVPAKKSAIRGAKVAIAASNEVF